MYFSYLLKTKANLNTNRMDCLLIYTYLIKSWMNIWYCRTWSIVSNFLKLIDTLILSLGFLLYASCKYCKMAEVGLERQLHNGKNCLLFERILLLLPASACWITTECKLIPGASHEPGLHGHLHSCKYLHINFKR